jgi:hypothetical protein
MRQMTTYSVRILVGIQAWCTAFIVDSNGWNGSEAAISPSGVLIAALERLAEQNRGRAWSGLMAVSGQFC